MKPRSAQELMRENLLVKHYAGSHAYGTALPSSDVDFRGIFCADPINVRTPFFNVRECEDQAEEDTKYYELAHFMKLCLDCNPNIVETLWVDGRDLVVTTTAYDVLRAERYKLLSSKIAFTTSGYALSQLKRIKGHNKWINNPQPKEVPQLKDFASKHDYHLAKDKHKHYWDWKNNRNEVRGEMEEKFGYDTKHAMHLVRLLRMGLEALRDGEIVVKRPDAEELLAIRNGSWTYEEVVNYAEEMDNEVRNVWYKKTELPKKPDIKFAAQLLMSVQDMVWSHA